MGIDLNNPNDLFVYDETSPSCLRWKVDRGSRAKTGQCAGTCHVKHRAWAVQFRGSPKLVHRVIWEMFYGDFEGIIEHINEDKTDNRISNLMIREHDKAFLKKSDYFGHKLRDIFDYEDGMLYWKLDRYSGAGGSVRAARTGDPVHLLYDKDGYAKFRYVGGAKRLHRAIWEWHYGDIPEGFQIDHYDRDVLNNKIENLRAVPQELNGRNVSIADRNQTGHMGVRYREYGDNKEKKAYIAFWREQGGQRERSFSCNKYGHDKAKDLAIKCREENIARLNELGYGYTPHHGKY